MLKAVAADRGTDGTSRGGVTAQMWAGILSSTHVTIWQPIQPRDSPACQTLSTTQTHAMQTKFVIQTDAVQTMFLIQVQISQTRWATQVHATQTMLEIQTNASQNQEQGAQSQHWL